MVRTDKKNYKSRAMAENSLGTHISWYPHLPRFAMFELPNEQQTSLWVLVATVWEVHNLKFIHQILS